MPDGSVSECRTPRCPGFAVRDGFCAIHQRTYRSYTGPPGAGIGPSNRTFRAARKAWLNEHPMCNVCKRAAAAVLDHIVPHRGSSRLFWDRANWQALCYRCHGVKTARETFGAGRL